jgi:hypothetical protein
MLGHPVRTLSAIGEGRIDCPSPPEHHQQHIHAAGCEAVRLFAHSQAALSARPIEPPAEHKLAGKVVSWARILLNRRSGVARLAQRLADAAEAGDEVAITPNEMRQYAERDPQPLPIGNAPDVSRIRAFLDGLAALHNLMTVHTCSLNPQQLGELADCCSGLVSHPQIDPSEKLIADGLQQRATARLQDPEMTAEDLSASFDYVPAGRAAADADDDDDPRFRPTLRELRAGVTAAVEAYLACNAR